MFISSQGNNYGIHPARITTRDYLNLRVYNDMGDYITSFDNISTTNFNVLVERLPLEPGTYGKMGVGS